MIAISFNIDGDFTSLANDLKRDIQDSMQAVTREAERILKQSIQQNLYNGSVITGNSLYYMNTGSIAQAFTARQYGNNMVIYMDSSKMYAYGYTNSPMVVGGGGRLGAYVGVRGQDFREEILQGLNVGGINPSRINPRGMRAGGYFEKAFIKMEQKLPIVLAKELRARGWDVSLS